MLETNETFDRQPEILTPGNHGLFCRHNGENPDYEIACEECDFFLEFFPEWEEWYD